MPHTSWTRTVPPFPASERKMRHNEAGTNKGERTMIMPAATTDTMSQFNTATRSAL